MAAPAFVRSRWVRIPLLLAVGVLSLLVLGVGGFITQRLIATTPAMYHTDGVVQAEVCSDDETPSETLVYTSLRPSNWDVFLFDSLDATPRRLTEHPNLDYNPVLSPDGRWVVFVSERDGDANLYARELSGDDEAIPLTTHPAMDDAPAFAPDGSQLAFVSTRDGSPDIFVMPFAPGDRDAESAAVNLTRHPKGDFNPSFSPDGSRIAFSSNRTTFGRWNPIRLVRGAEAATDIHVMDADGRNPRRVVRALGISGSPAWTEAGDALLYYNATGLAQSGVYRVGLDGRGRIRLSPDSIMGVTPTAGPDGSVIFVGMDRSEVPIDEPALQRHGGRLYRVDADGTGLTAFGPAGIPLLAPHFDPSTGRLVSHGEGPVPEDLQMANGTPFTWPGAVRTVRLGDRCVRVHALRSYFPSIAESGEAVVAVKWAHEQNGSPRGPSPLMSASLDGRSLTSILSATDAGFMWTPVVTRDGAWIFYSKGPRFGGARDDVDIWKVRSDGTGAVNLTADSDANDAFPDPSADGRWIVFRSGRGSPVGERGRNDIYVMDAEGGQLRAVTQGGGNHTMPAVSPDGERVVFTTDRAGRGMKLWIQSLTDPTDEGRLLEPGRAHLTGLDMHPRFSPDGTWVVFTSDRAGYKDESLMSGLFPQTYGTLYAVPVDGNGPAVRLTDDKWEDGLPFWSAAPGG